MPQATFPRTGGDFKHVCGSDSDAFNIPLYLQVLSTIGVNCSGDESEELVPAVYDALRGINPRNEIEGMLAAQMVATHHATMYCLRRAQIEGMVKFAEGWTNQATKLSRSCLSIGKWLLERHSQQGANRQHGEAAVEQVKPQKHLPEAAPSAAELLVRGGADRNSSESNDQVSGPAAVGQAEPGGGSYHGEAGAPSSEPLPEGDEAVEILERRTEEAVAKELQVGADQHGSGARDERRLPPVRDKSRCRMHGGSSGNGAPRGNKNAQKHAHYTAQALALRRQFVPY
jgi:hypothetical protein